MASTQQLLLGEGAGGAEEVYVEDVFSTYLYTGTGSSLPIVNNIDLATKGGLVWIKRRDAIDVHALIDTARGTNSWLGTERTLTPYSYSGFTSFNSNGFTLGAPVESSTINGFGRSLSSWTFRKQPKFFDVVTWTGNGGSGNRQIAHSLGSVPGFITMKNTSSASSWPSYHRSLGANVSVDLNSAAASGASSYYPATPTSTYFEINAGGSFNTSGQTYVAYIFAHDAGGFGLTGTDNVISCGTWTGAQTAVTLGWEPQWVLSKRTDSATVGAWEICDNMRGMPALPGSENYLLANTSAAEVSGGYNFITPTATGFKTDTTAAGTYIYIAIRRGPMKVPTDATKVFIPVANTVSSDNTVATTNFPVDLIISKIRTTTERWWWFDKLRGTQSTGPSKNLSSDQDSAEGNIPSNGYGLASMTTYVDNFQYYWNGTSRTFINYALRRAPSFFDEVCYTGNGTTQNIAHNLGVAPELMLVKRRDTAAYWPVYSVTLGNSSILQLETDGAVQTGASQWNSTTPTSSVFSLGSTSGANASGGTYVAYLFATCAGVSKVGSYTGNATLRTIDCGFTGGARFVLIKRTNTTGSWIVYDTARGMVANTDYAQYWDTDAAQSSATNNSVYTITTGFQLLASPAYDVNTSGGTYIFLAIA